MKFIEQHIAQVERIFEQYKGQEPLHLYLKKYFKKNKKYGSRDRRNISEYLYGVYRIGRENRHLSIRERVYFFLFLKGELKPSFFEEHFKELGAFADKSFETKLGFLRLEYGLRETFRTQTEISDRIDMEDYRNSFYKEPKVFIRFRNQSASKYTTEIKDLEGENIENDCFAFSQKAKLEDYFKANDYVVQDLNSQRTLNYTPELGKGSFVWDCCAGSGGKSILFLDKYPDIELSVTDVRASILKSLISRFQTYHLEAEIIAEMNLNKPNDISVLGDRAYDFILCDVPCTGSGTWARTPEQFYFFEKKEVAVYHKRQLDILSNASAKMKMGGDLLYITCSVFYKENEEVLKSFLEDNENYILLETAYLDGTKCQADTLFVAKVKRVK